MKKIFFSILVLALSLQAADKIAHFSIQEALSSDLARQKLPDVSKFKFGSNSGKGHNIITRNITSNKRANAALRGADGKKTACQRAFISALIAFNNRISKEGGSKAVNLVSYFRKNTYDSTTQFECAIGSLMTAVTLKGDIAK
ncbi:MAG: excinuclease ABC subunit A [Campylobacter sp.]|nr:excinuclease ABC subunit A [Campylobacter sp.]